MVKIGLLFSGQGSQIPKLGQDFYETYPTVKGIYDAYPQIRDLAFTADADTLNRTENAQRILILFHVAMTELLKQTLSYHAAMGISLGEYGALYAGDVLGENEVITTVEKRADAMRQASSAFPLSSIAVLGKDFTRLLEQAGENSYYISNRNSPSQMVITGQNLDQWKEKLQTEYRLIPLQISGGFHSPYMAPVETMLRAHFQTLTLREPSIPLFFNYGVEAMDLKERMAKQVSHTIDVHQSLCRIVERCDCLIEIGANRILENLVKKIDKTKTIYALQTVENYEKVRKELGTENSNCNGRK